MARYAAQRAIQAIPTLLLITVVSFVLMHIIPGGPAEAMLGNKATPELIARINRSLGLNKPLYVQYWVWLQHLVTGNLGYSYSYHQSVLSLIELNLPRTLLLVVTAIVISHVVAILVGVYQSAHRSGVWDHVITVITYFTYSMPTFWLGILLLGWFAVRLGWLPTGGLSNILIAHPGFLSYVRHLILPALTLILVTVAGWSRYMRSSMIETLVEDYVRTARAKGASEARVLFRHALRNALLPLITLAGMSLPLLFSGALIIEMIFDYPGMGLLFWDAAQARDYPVLLGIVVVVGFLTVLGNFLADILYGIVDPRIQYN